jgi:ankyrin repeat protein
MRAEHVTKGGHDYVFVTGNYNLKTQAILEWLYVAGDEHGTRLEPPSSDMGHGRIIQPIDELLQKPLAQAAKLTREEMIAIVMYTGPAFVLYNAVLRRFPADMYEVFKSAGNLFSTTIFVLVSAINKLSRCMNIPSGTLLYRGLGGTLEFPERFTRPDPGCKTPNALGFLEYGFMSTTADKSIAVQYSGVEEGKPKAGILQIRPNSVDRGADISEFSQYPAEKEYLFVPYSFVQGEGRQRTEVTAGGGILTVVPVHVNINLKTETVDELKAKKKRLHLASARAVLEEVRYELEQWAASAESSERLQRDPTRNHGGTFTAATFVAKLMEQCDAVVERHKATGVEEFVDDGVFRALVSEVLDTKAWAKEKKELWMQDASQYIVGLQGESLRNCHRRWQSFLRGSMSGAGGRFADGAFASVLLLKSRGLVKRGVEREENADGEDVMVQAGADGWNAIDIYAASASGADVDAVDSAGMTGVCYAARYEHLESMIALLKAGVDVNKCDNNGSSPILIAAAKGNAAAIQHLVSYRGDVNKCDNKGASPIWIAAQEGHAAVIQQLFSCGGDVNKCNNNGISPIFIAAYNGRDAVIQQLFSCRGDVNKCDNNGTSPIWIAVLNGHDAVIQQLISCGGDVNKCNNNGISPIFVAAQKGYAAAIQQLFSCGGDVNKCDNNGASPICFAAQQGHAAAIQQLLACHADPRSSWNGTSALDKARAEGHLECARLLEAAVQ